jgi:hypothetical protein
MENQQRIRGYRELSERELQLIGAVKETGEVTGDMIKQLESIPEVDKRWLAIAKTDLQKGFMALTRAIAKPESF